MASDARDSESASRDGDTTTAEEIASEIRDFEGSIDEPDNWRILIPVDDFNEVEDLIDAEQHLGASFRGITLCYTDHHEQTRVEYKNNLSDHMEGSA